MNRSNVRMFVYKYAVIISLLIAVSVVFCAHFISPVPETLADKATLVTISVTLAGFLFTGQGIMLTLPPNNRFIQLVKEHGYLEDFHRLCRWSEMAFIISVVFSLEIITGLFADKVLSSFLYLISFMWPLIMAFWALWIFGNVVGSADL